MCPMAVTAVRIGHDESARLGEIDREQRLAGQLAVARGDARALAGAAAELGERHANGVYIGV